MCNFATLVLYERHGHAAIGYRAETIDQIACGDMAEGTRGAWELRCWTPTGESSIHGVSSDELVSLIDAVLRTTRQGLDDDRALDAIQRFQCLDRSTVAEIPSGLPLAEHLVIWRKSVETTGVFLQASHLDTEKLRTIGDVLRREIETMVRCKDELIGRSYTPAKIE